MQLIVKMLVSFFIVLTISGCSHKLIYVPTKCNITTVEYPMVDLVNSNTMLGESKRCFKNYIMYKEAFEKQNKMIEVCK